MLLVLGGRVALAAAPESAPATSSLEARVAALEAEIARLRAAEAAAAAAAGAGVATSTPAAPPPATTPPEMHGAAHLLLPDDVRLRLTGYVDLGLFDAFGDGVAYVRDAGHALYPEYDSFTWVFYGDPWSNPINAQGDSADLGLDRTNVPRFDPIQSHGKSSFLVNTLNLGLVAGVGERLLFESSVNFEPRQGTLGSAGDQIDVDLAYLEWIPLPGRDLHFFAGKFESTFGIEYRRRKAPDRFGVTPSIIARYTVGPLTGLKIRGGLGGVVTYAFAVSNGSTFTEKFAHFFNEVDTNDVKTVSGRVSVRTPPRWPVFVEVGASGVFGAQDLQPTNDTLTWQVGADLNVVFRDFELRAEYLHADVNGAGLESAGENGGSPRLRANGWYAEVVYQVLPWLGVLARVDQRVALMFAEPNLYVTNTLRLTGALRFDVTFNVVAKLEYLHLFELGTPDIVDDVITSSLILRF
ncbi:MAG TPA: hypothetical protein VG389_22165 [Myxococcota bacterium]|nr:hypothetical protein [Myxococcota bacterium]